jgi:pimeloyl-ACP methyl ester carboxylesterase
VRIEVKVARGIFEGAIAKDSSTIDGTWKQSGLQLPLLLERIQKEITIERPQDPKKPYPYREEEVSYRNTSAGVTLAGTLTLPASGSPFPAVLLISGSGPEDRNETVFGHHPFWVLADYLTRRGIAVLRVDDRGVGGSTGSTSRSTTEDFAEDVLAGVNFLLNRHEIDSRHIGLIGHSEGGMIAPMAAVRSSDVDFIVLLAAPGLPGDEILYLQAAAIARADGASDELIAKNRATQERIFAVLKSEADSTTAADKRLRNEFLQC